MPNFILDLAIYVSLTCAVLSSIYLAYPYFLSITRWKWARFGDKSAGSKTSVEGGDVSYQVASSEVLTESPPVPKVLVVKEQIRAPSADIVASETFFEDIESLLNEKELVEIHRKIHNTAEYSQYMFDKILEATLKDQLKEFDPEMRSSWGTLAKLEQFYMVLLNHGEYDQPFRDVEKRISEVVREIKQEGEKKSSAWK